MADKAVLEYGAGSEPAASRQPSPSVSPERAVGEGDGWLTLLCLTLLGYALFGKGWAYVGVPPFFIGELVLVCGVVWGFRFGRWSGIGDLPAFWFLMLLVAWGLLRIVPDFPRYGVESLRDAVIWGYCAFALLVFGALRARPALLTALLHRYRQFSQIFLGSIALIWILVRIYPRPAIPNWPWADVPMLHPKGGDVLVHSAGTLAFWVAGFGGPVGTLRVLMLAFTVVLVGTYDRSGLLSFLAVFTVCFFLRANDRSLWRLVGMGICGLLLLAVTNFRVPMPGREREISSTQFVSNLASLVGVSHTGDLDDTKQWRLEWWRDVLRYTLEGKYFWTGKGFGVNLADDDGYQVEEDGSLRNPHSGHLTMLARGGVPGLMLWLLVQLSWAGSMFRGYVRSRSAGHGRWAGLFLFLLAYWLAFMVNASFDVFLEGPMGGIWFWTLFGVGLAALCLYRSNPEVLEELPVECPPSAQPLPAGGEP